MKHLPQRPQARLHRTHLFVLVAACAVVAPLSASGIVLGARLVSPQHVRSAKPARARLPQSRQRAARPVPAHPSPAAFGKYFLGVLNQRPDLRWRSKALPELQLSLLRAAAARVRRGGTVVYSVCTMHVEENEAVVDAAGLEVDDLGAEWPAFRHPDRPEFLLTMPHIHGTAGFFIARLRA